MGLSSNKFNPHPLQIILESGTMKKEIKRTDNKDGQGECSELSDNSDVQSSSSSSSSESEPQESGGRDTVDNAVADNGTDLRPADVLLGRGTGPANHAGNIYFRDVVERVKPSYVNTTSRKIKNKLVQQVVNDIKSRGGRFLRKRGVGGGGQGVGGDNVDDDAASTTPAEGEVFEVVDDQVAFEKTKQAIRYVHYKKEPNEVEKRSKQQPSPAEETSSPSHATKSMKRVPPTLLSQTETTSAPPGIKRRRTDSTDRGSLTSSSAAGIQLLHPPSESGALSKSAASMLLDSLSARFPLTMPTPGSSSLPHNLLQSRLATLLQQQQQQQQQPPLVHDSQLLLLLAQYQQQQQQQQQQSQHMLLNHLSSSLSQGPYARSFLDAVLMRSGGGGAKKRSSSPSPSRSRKTAESSDK